MYADLWNVMDPKVEFVCGLLCVEFEVPLGVLVGLTYRLIVVDGSGEGCVM